MPVTPTPPNGPKLNEQDVLIFGDGRLYKSPDVHLDEEQRRARTQRIFRAAGTYPHSSREASLMDGLLDFSSPEGAAKYALVAKEYEERVEQRKLDAGETLKSLVDMNGNRPSSLVMENLTDEFIGNLEDAQAHQRMLVELEAEVGDVPDEADQRFGDVDRLAKWRFDPTLLPAMFYMARYRNNFMFEKGVGKDHTDDDYTTLTGQLLQSTSIITSDRTVTSMKGIIAEARQLEANRARFWAAQIFGSEAEPEKGIRQRSGLIDVQSLKGYLEKKFQAVAAQSQEK